jgi:predicted phosphodiesterase
VLLVGIAAAAAAVVALGGVRADVGPVEARLSLELSTQGGTEVEVPPVGRLQMGTHAGPLRLRADVRSVDVEAVTAMIRGGSPLPTVETMSVDVQRGLTRLAVRSTAVGLLAAALACALVFRRPRAVLVGTLAAAGALAVSGGVAAATFSSQALEEPTFDGLLAQAPALVGGVSQAASRVDAYGARLAELTGNVSQLYGALGSLPEVPGPDTTTVLWVSDVHNNAAAYGVMRELVDQFEVEAVVDTGDSTDVGSAAENFLLDDIEDLGVPYLWVRGNHDSATTQRYMSTLDNVTVLDGPEVVEVAGVRWAGVGDPRFTPVKRIAEPSEIGLRELRAAGRRLATGLAQGGRAVDVVLVHESPMAGPLHGQVPLVLNGHVHERREQRVDGTLELTLGSSGGAGLRTFDGGDTALPLEMTILHLDPTTARWSPSTRSPWPGSARRPSRSSAGRRPRWPRSRRRGDGGGRGGCVPALCLYRRVSEETPTTETSPTEAQPTSPFADLDAFQALPRAGGLLLSVDGTRLVTSLQTLDPEATRFVTALWEVDPAGARPPGASPGPPRASSSGRSPPTAPCCSPPPAPTPTSPTPTTPAAARCGPCRRAVARPAWSPAAPVACRGWWSPAARGTWSCSAPPCPAPARTRSPTRHGARPAPRPR